MVIKVEARNSTQLPSKFSSGLIWRGVEISSTSSEGKRHKEPRILFGTSSEEIKKNAFRYSRES